jgi:low affinity Fe/Cu permease
MKELFRKIAARISNATGTANAFLIALGIIIVWGVTGPAFGYSDTWQLVINTGTTIVTFLMVFLIQNTQNRDSKAIHLKLDELIRSTKSARNAFVDLENFTDADLELLDREFKEAHEELKENATVRRLRKQIEEEKSRRLSVKGAGIAAGAAVKTFVEAPFKVMPKLDSKKKK